MINRNNLKHLTELARLKIIKEREEKIIKDLENILSYFEQLKKIDTVGIEPLIGGASLKNVFREDESAENDFFNKNSVKNFPEERDGFLKIPPVF